MSNYKKPTKTRPTKVSSVALFLDQVDVCLSKNLNVSAICRDALEKFLQATYPGDLDKAKKKREDDRG